MNILRRADQWWEKISPKRRVDANLGNAFMLLGLMLPSLSIVLNGPVPNTLLVHMSESLQIGMCVCIFLGCGMKLHGLSAGHRFWFRRTPLKRCYALGFSGAPIAFVGCITYGYYILSNSPNFWSALSGVATPLFGFGILAQSFFYVLEYRRIDRNEALLRGIEQTKSNGS